MVSKGNHPQMAELFGLVKSTYYSLPTYIYIYIYTHTTDVNLKTLAFSQKKTISRSP